MQDQAALDQEGLDRFLGCLLGVAVGDALGAPVALRTHYDIEKRYGVLRDMVGGGWLHLEPGQWTGDTAQTLALAETYVARRSLDFDDFTQRLLDWFEGDPPEIGAHTRKVLEYLKEYPARSIIAGRKLWYNSGATAAGSGSLARCAPTALFRWRNVEEMVRESILASQITHFDPRTCEACIVANFVILRCLRGEFGPDLPKQADVFMRSLHQLPLYHQLVANYEASKIKEAEPWSMGIPYLEDMESVERAVRSLSRLSKEDIKSSGYVVDTLQAALCILLRAPSFSEGLIEAVNLGGDTGTLGAVVGGMLGARFGYSQIPTEWVGRIWEGERILNIAEILYRIAPPAEPTPVPLKPPSRFPTEPPARPPTEGYARPASGAPGRPATPLDPPGKPRTRNP